MTKESLLRLLGNDDLDAVLSHLLEYARKYRIAELRSDALIQSGQLEAYKKGARNGTASFEEQARQRAVVRKALLELVEALPDSPPALSGPGKRTGMREPVFKNLVFWGMLAGKSAVVGWLLFQADTGGFSKKELGVTISLLLPVFTAHFMAMFNDFLKNRYVSPLDPGNIPKRVRWSIPLITAIIMAVYFGLMLYIIGQRGQGSGPMTEGSDFLQSLEESKRQFEQMTASLMLLETAIGIYIGLLINTFFEKSKE